MRRIGIYSLLLILLASPIATWFLFKPSRVLLPTLTGMTCVDEYICIDEPSHLPQAQSLYHDALRFVETRIGDIQSPPRAVFCVTEACSKIYGMHEGSYGYAAAYNVGTFGMAISYRGWQPYYLRHELIHHLQNEHLGSLNAWFFKPDWFKEGMAYALSNDPRRPLPLKLEQWRHQYKRWAKTVPDAQFWAMADAL